MVAEVFDLLHPCTRDVLETLTIQVLTESNIAGLTSFTHTIRERQRKLRGEVGNTPPESSVSEGESHGERAKPTLVARVKPPTLAASREAAILATRKVTTGQAAGLAMPWQAA